MNTKKEVHYYLYLITAIKCYQISILLTEFTITIKLYLNKQNDIFQSIRRHVQKDHLPNKTQLNQ